MALMTIDKRSSVSGLGRIYTCATITESLKISVHEEYERDRLTWQNIDQPPSTREKLQYRIDQWLKDVTLPL